jgi:hypothetical protein
MNTVKVKKDRLLTKLKENRETHRANFIKAQTGYRQEVIEQLDKALQDARDGKKITTAFRLPTPSDHTSEYDTAIEMLDWTIGDEIELSQIAFRNYIFDDWDWSQNWMVSNSSYLNKKI